jgi:hypothetical protein
MSKKYSATISFTGLASLNIEAENAEDAREKLLKLTIEDLARQGHVDVAQLKVIPRQITVSGAILGGDDGDDPQTNKPIGERPSGWYRPLI